jgi:hypothetical protein
MAGHHTKDKGDLGVAKAHADLVGQGCIVLFPATEHAPFDLVAYRDGNFHRIQVKYRTATAGAIHVQFRSMWADRNGTHIQSTDKDAIDLVCIYCPDTDSCYYLRPHEFRKSATLRVTPSRNNQHSGVRMASEFSEVPLPVSELGVDEPSISETGVP